ncbi:MAG TPA: adenylate kinase [Actinokineospora sp.]|nr:adenylate kinase [Actinokineospora sp.]
MQRVLIAGISGAGKTTLAIRVAAALSLPRYELDMLHHGPNWTKRPEFEADVARFAATDRWICEAQYHRILDNLLWRRADTVLWLDLPRRTVMRRVIRRSLSRAITGRELFNGNREHFRDWLEPDHPIRWAWSRHGLTSTDTSERLAAHPEIKAIRFTTASDVRRWLADQPWARSAKRL